MYNTAFKVLEVLEESEGPVSGEQISGRLGISRSAVWKHIKELKGMGYEIEASQKEGYRLTKKSNRLLPYEVHKRLRTNFIGKKMRYYENTPSTIWVGKQLATEGDAEKINGMVIIAEEQTGGIGRLGRSWVSPAGGVWITLIKWPNDIYIGDKKVAGLLLELYAEADKIHYCLLSLGVDVNISPSMLESVKGAVTSISAEMGHDVDRASFLARLLKEFESRYLLIESGEYEAVIREWKSLSCTLEHRVRINTMKATFEGEAIDIDEFGALLIRKDNGKVERVIAGDCIQR
jgi:BirA family biotin operon repressor/biotin-[acetyl-CoA-carboxylase] ligase